MFPKRLCEGYQTFLEGRFHSESSRYQALAEKGQNPEILIIGCCDSRVSPDAIFDAGPGEMFVVRNVANLVPPYDPDHESSYHGTSAAIEFAVNGLNVKHIVVLGHASCGGIRSFFDDAKPLSKVDFIGKWMSQITPVAERLGPGTGDRAANKYQTPGTGRDRAQLEQPADLPLDSQPGGPRHLATTRNLLRRDDRRIILA